MGSHYETSGGVITRYYLAGGTRVAMRTGSASFYWLLSDHLGSTSKVATAAGALHSQQLYKAWGESRYTRGTLPTRYTYTGQYSYASDFGLVFYGSRFYDPYLNRWTSPDTIIPEPYNPLDWDRYSYARNSPLNYTDPDGHRPCNEERGCGDTPVDEFQLKLGRSYEGLWDTKAQQEATKRVERAFEAGEFIITILWEPADWAATTSDCLNGDCNPLMLLGLLPFVPSSVGHHTIPRQILNLLPEDIANAVRGVPGSPNIWQIPEPLHKTIHSGPGPGGYYNAVWREAIKPLLDRGNITPQEIFNIREQLVAAFGIWKWRP